jgi:hypothetical protein
VRQQHDAIADESCRRHRRCTCRLHRLGAEHETHLRQLGVPGAG